MSRGASPATAGLAAAVIAAAASAQAGPAPLFDGSSLAGWSVVNGAAESFTAANGVLRVTGPEGWLKSDGRRQDFRLRIELRFLTDDADSGVFLRARDEGVFIRGWPNESYQVQLRNPAGESPFPPIGGLFRHGMPDGPIRFDPADAARLSPPTGEWQTLEIEAVGESLRVHLQGELLMEAEGLATRPGFIGIQSEQGEMEIRLLELETL